MLNADCQVTASIASAVPNKVVWFGMECAPYDEGIADFDEHVDCIKCGAPLEFTRRSFAHLGTFTCPSCGHTHHAADITCVAINDKQEKSCTLTLRVHNREITVPVNVRAGYDIYNAVAAFAALTTLGLPEDQICEALGHFKHAAHRFEIFDVEGTQTRLLLMKNTAGANQLLNMLASEKEVPTNLVCLLGNQVMDGIYTDWVRGVHWEKLLRPETRAIIGGPCYQDLRESLLAAGFAEDALSVETDYAALVDKIGAMNEPVTVIANCSTVEDLRLELVKRYKPIDYWNE